MPVNPALPMMQNKRAILLLLCALSLPLPAPALAADDLFSIMFRMMLTMMNVMANAVEDDGGGFNDWGLGGTNSLGMGMTGMPMMSGMTGMSPWASGMSPWSYAAPGGGGWGNPFSGAPAQWWSPGGMNYPVPGGNGLPAFNRGAAPVPGPYSRQPEEDSLLGGKWYGNTGEILEVRGNRFRLQAGKTAITGVVRIENNIVHLFSPQTGTVTRYTFVRNQTDLILQDVSGRLLNFHKRPFNRGGFRY